MSTWDVFHSDRLEVERALSTDDVRAALTRGDIHDDDLVRPAGAAVPWLRLTEVPELTAAAGPAPELDDFEVVEEEPAPPPPTIEPVPISTAAATNYQAAGEFDLNLDPGHFSTPHIDDPDVLDEPEDWQELIDPQDEDEEAAEFTLSRKGADTVEELDLAAMVDVAFQLVLFFLVTATTIMYKSLEVPKPKDDKPSDQVQQGAKPLDEMQKDYILVEIDPAGNIKVDKEATQPSALIEKLRSAREATARKSMLLSADFTTHHRSAVQAYDAANEIGLGIAIAKPVDPTGGAGPLAPPAAKKAAPRG